MFLCDRDVFVRCGWCVIPRAPENTPSLDRSSQRTDRGETRPATRLSLGRRWAAALTVAVSSDHTSSFHCPRCPHPLYAASASTLAGAFRPAAHSLNTPLGTILAGGPPPCAAVPTPPRPGNSEPVPERRLATCFPGPRIPAAAYQLGSPGSPHRHAKALPCARGGWVPVPFSPRMGCSPAADS